MRRRTPSTAEHEQLGALLRIARLEAHLTQLEVASKLDRIQSFVAKVESGERKLEVLEFCEYCKIVNADPLELLKPFSRE